MDAQDGALLVPLRQPITNGLPPWQKYNNPATSLLDVRRLIVLQHIRPFLDEFGMYELKTPNPHAPRSPNTSRAPVSDSRKCT